MPVKSEAQRRFMGAVAGGKVPGVKPEVGKEFLKETPKGKKLPKRSRAADSPGAKYLKSE